MGRLPVVTRDAPATVIGIISRSDLLTAHEPRLAATWHAERTFDVRRMWLSSDAEERGDGSETVAVVGALDGRDAAAGTDDFAR